MSDYPAPSTGTSSRPTARTRPEHEWLTTPEAAHFLRLSARTLERFRVEGTGPIYTKAGPGKRSRVLYHRDALIAWLTGAQHESTADYA